MILVQSLSNVVELLLGVSDLSNEPGHPRTEDRCPGGRLEHQIPPLLFRDGLLDLPRDRLRDLAYRVSGEAVIAARSAHGDVGSFRFGTSIGPDTPRRGLPATRPSRRSGGR